MDWKKINSGLNGLKPDLCSAGKVLCQWSYRANWELVVIWVHEMPIVWGYLTNRFHVAVHLFNNRPQMTSKYSKIYFSTNAREHGIYAFYTIKGQIIWKFCMFQSKMSQVNPSPFWKTHANSHLMQSMVYATWSKSLVSWRINALRLIHRNHTAVKLELKAVIIFVSVLW